MIGTSGGTRTRASRTTFGPSSTALSARSIDWFRHSSISSAHVDHKEWHHFSIVAPTIELIVNVSVTAERGVELGRLVVLGRSAEGWHGAAELARGEEVTVRHARIDAVIGRSRLWFERGSYRLAVTLPDDGIELEASLKPLTHPAPVYDFDLEDSPPLHWIVLPRLRAKGWARVAGREHTFADALAYHDHNWGSFAWGQNFAWEWGFALPSDRATPWTVVFARLGDRARTRTFSQTLFLWRGPELIRIFHARDLRLSERGFLVQERVVRAPGVLGLLVPGTTADVPAQLIVDGSGDGDRLSCAFACSDFAQVLVPNDDDPGITVINEVSAGVSVEGIIRGEPVQFEGRANVEVVGAA